MFGRQISLEPVNDQTEQWRRNECLRQLLAARAIQAPSFAQLTRAAAPLRNDGLTFDLNLILLDDTGCVQPADLYLRPPRTLVGQLLRLPLPQSVSRYQYNFFFRLELENIM